MLERQSLSSIQRIALPRRYEIDLFKDGLSIQRLASTQQIVDVQVVPYRSRGENCRRVLAERTSGEKLVIEFTSFKQDYDSDISGVIRSRIPTLDTGLLSFGAAVFIEKSVSRVKAKEVRDRVAESWRAGIRYRSELHDETDKIVREGLRTAQSGALHAIAAHWTLADSPALVVMPTGTGKTEVMIAAAVDSTCDRLLVVVPSDALRQQTADKFSNYGILQKIGVVDDLPFPVVGKLASTPTKKHLRDIEACNVVVATMSALGRADETIQRALTQRFSHVFFDEAHHIEAASWKRFQKHCNDARTLLLTATPFREDGKPIDGRIIYNFPLSLAQRDKCFQPVRFVDVFEPDDTRADAAIAEAAVQRLKEDLEDGFDHFLMARAKTIDAARQLFDNVYQPNYADLNPVLIHSRTPGKQSVLNDIRQQRHRIVVCVDMFGEGFDLPNLKIAALHSVHKSLGITLQFIGRFTRSSEGVGPATFVANTAEDGVPESLESLYQEDADWNLLLPDLSFDAIAPQTELSDLVANLRSEQTGGESIEISTLALRPTISAHVFRTPSFHPERYADAFRGRQRIVQAEISRRDRFVAVIVNHQDRPDWTDSRDISVDCWDLYLAWYDIERKLLYVHSSRKRDAASQFAKYISAAPDLICNDETFRVFSGLQRLTLHSVGLSSRSRNVRYQMFAGLDVRNAIDPVQQQSKLKSNISGVGYEGGSRQGVGCSRKGKIWSMRSGSIADWISWCREIGHKVADESRDPNDFLKYTLIPEVICQFPDSEALMADWPDQLFESSHFHFEVITPTQSFAFYECQVDLLDWTPAGDAFRFRLLAGDSIESVLKLSLQESASGEREDEYQVELESGGDCDIAALRQRYSVAEFFNQNPPLVRLADGSQLSGNILLRPQEELHDTFDREKIRTLDWSGIDITKESRWKDGVFTQNSVQQHFIEELEQSPATFIIDDDDTGETADVVAIEETDDTIFVHLWHCKFSTGAHPGRRDKDLFVVCGQAQKSVKWTWSFERLVRQLKDRETQKKNGRDTRFVLGTLQELVTLRKRSRRRFIQYHIGIVQPGLSKANAPVEHLTLLGSTNSFIQCVTGNPLAVVAST